MVHYRVIIIKKPPKNGDLLRPPLYAVYTRSPRHVPRASIDPERGKEKKKTARWRDEDSIDACESRVGEEAPSM